MLADVESVEEGLFPDVNGGLIAFTFSTFSTFTTLDSFRNGEKQAAETLVLINLIDPSFARSLLTSGSIHLACRV